MATLATGLLARFGRAGFAPAGFHQEVSPFHLRFLPFHAFPSAITRPAVVKRFFHFFSYLNESFSFFLVCGHTPTLALERPVARRILFRRRSDPSPPYALSPCHFITLVLPTKHLFDPDGP